ncbi:MAG: L-ribulose-5-phosphate 4-epimerase [Thermotogaceae bacterium]|nr:L-ribulose-5-phosphate 4-epimerase [Thermotogaceae bacterium]
MFEELKREVHRAHLILERYNLVAYTSGNVSLRVEGEKVIIKPSGVPYDRFKPEDLVIVNLEGNKIEGELKPSVDTATHLYIYRNLDWVNSIIHTHSTFVTVFAMMEKSIPVLCTAHADVFGAEIPLTEYAPVGSEAIGRATLNVLNKAGVVILRKHGALILGKSLEDAIKKAIFMEEVAKASYFALMSGRIEPLPREEVEKLYNQYHTKYGQSK